MVEMAIVIVELWLSKYVFAFSATCGDHPDSDKDTGWLAGITGNGKKIKGKWKTHPLYTLPSQKDNNALIWLFEAEWGLWA